MKKCFGRVGLGLFAVVVALSFQDVGYSQAISSSKASSSAQASANANANAQTDDSYSPSRTGFGHNSRTSTSTSRRVSVTENGRKVTITEDGSGVSVTVNGKTVRAANAVELQKKHPDAYRLYEKHIGAAQASGSARTSTNSSTRTSKSSGSQQNSESRSSANRSVSLMENGRKISITEGKNGIIVSVDGKAVRAANSSELKRKFPEAHRLYEKHLGAAAKRDGLNQPNANALLRDELQNLREQNSDKPQLRGLIEKMLKDLGN